MGITRYNDAKTMVIHGITMARNYISWDMDGYGALFLVELHLFFYQQEEQQQQSLQNVQRSTHVDANIHFS